MERYRSLTLENASAFLLEGFCQMKPWILWSLAGLAMVALALFGATSILSSNATTPWSPPPTPSESTDSPLETNSDSSSSAENGQPQAQDSQDGSSDASSDDNPQSSVESIAIQVNDESIKTSALDRAFRTVLDRYQESYADQGKSLEEALKGPSGAYLELQIRHQAAQLLIERRLLEQRAEQRGLAVEPQEMEQAFQDRYSNFLDHHGVTEQQLRDIFQRPDSRRIAQRILGVRESSVEALRDRLRREERIRLLKKAMARDLMNGDEVDLGAEETQNRLTQWLDEVKSNSEIVYHEPLLKAYHKESRISEAEELRTRLARLEEAIAAYKATKDDVDSPYLDYFLGQLYNLRVNWSSALRDQINDSASGADASSTDTAASQTDSQQLDQAIRDSRTQATELLSPFDIQNEQQLLRIMQADPNNPLYKYMYAKYLINSDSPRWSVAVRMLNRAIELNPNYVDAYVLFGNLRMTQSSYSAAVERYRQALDVYDDARQQFRGVSKELAQRKLAKAHINNARKLKRAEDASGDWQRPLEQAKEILGNLESQLGAQSGGYAAVLASLGEVAMLEERYGDAQARFQASLDAQDSTEVRVKLGHAYREAGAWEQAEKVYRQVLQSTPGFALAHEGLARLYQEKGQTQQAVDQLRLAFTEGDQLGYQERRQLALEALELDSNATELRIELANYYLAQNVYEGALDQFRTVLEGTNKSVVARLGIGRVHFHRVNYPDALEQFRRALEETPTPSQKIEIYRWIVKTQQRQVGVGQPLPQSGQEALWELAQLYSQTGQPDESFRTLMDIRERYPEFRPEAVQQLIDQLSNSSGGDPQPGKSTPDQGHEIIEPNQDHGPYATTPPTSGPHYVIPADWGIHAEPIQDEVQLRNLAGGGVLVQYQPGLDEAIQQQLRELVQTLRQEANHCRLVLAPYEGLDAPVMLTAWTRVDALESFDATRIRRFVEAFAGKGPEVSEVGCTLPES